MSIILEGDWGLGVEGVGGRLGGKATACSACWEQAWCWSVALHLKEAALDSGYRHEGTETDSSDWDNDADGRRAPQPGTGEHRGQQPWSKQYPTIDHQPVARKYRLQSLPFCYQSVIRWRRRWGSVCCLIGQHGRPDLSIIVLPFIIQYLVLLEVLLIAPGANFVDRSVL